jgi:hypothetical protein
MINFLFIFLIVIIILYLLGISLINLIDNRLSKIKINIPKQDIVINYPDKNIENFENNKNSTVKNEREENKQNKINNNNNNNNNNNTKKTNFDSEYYDQMNKNSKIEGFSNSEPQEYKGWNIEKKKTHVCIKNHNHLKNGKDLNCTYGLTNYADPKDMSEIDLKIFILNYPPNLTLQDYINWLYCYVDKEDQLPYNHLKNLQKLKQGKELIEEHGILPPPSYNYPPLSSEDYFDKMYNNINEFNIAPPLNSNTASMVGYNYNDYSEFSQNSDLYGSTGVIRNSDIALKKNVKKLYDFVNPKDSNSLNFDKENEIYRIKNVEV